MCVSSMMFVHSEDLFYLPFRDVAVVAHLESTLLHAENPRFNPWHLQESTEALEKST